MTEPEGPRADVLARLLLIQSAAGQLPDETSILGFVCRGLEHVPGVSRAWHGDASDDAAGLPADRRTFPIQLGTKRHGQIVVRLADQGQFAAYAPHITNVAFMLAVMLEERQQRRLGESHERELECRVEARTMQLTEEVRERQGAEALAIAEKHRAEDYLDIAEAIIVELDERGQVAVINTRGCDLLGRPADEILGRDWFDLAVPPEIRDAARGVFDRIMTGRVDVPSHYENAILSSTGDQRYVEWHSVVRRIGGKPSGTLSSGLDITERKNAELERARLEGELLQAQKMESVGRLAGGVAHDFNNMLGVILGHTELALEQADPALPLHDDLQEIHKAATRSADLTRQLLAFARKQTVVPKVLDLNDTVAGMLKMLRRLIGEDIRLTWQPGERLWPVRVDPSQINQILTNLCVNARDAIADVGAVAIAMANCTFDEAYCAQHAGYRAGEYVRLVVGDDGCGMDQDTLSHLFEPFFSTKGLGKGTGLGLATVYGIVQQNNGFICVRSAPGSGTTFEIHLPRHVGEAQQSTSAAPATPRLGHETILLVEDEAGIRRTAARMLEYEGYTVLAAGTPGEAIRIAEGHPGHIHLLLADVILPEMNGHELAAHLTRLRPELTRLFMAGYTADVIGVRGVLDGGIHFIQKPFSRGDLAAKVRAVLDSPNVHTST